jgi:hypothetical protein
MLTALITLVPEPAADEPPQSRAVGRLDRIVVAAALHQDRDRRVDVAHEGHEVDRRIR